MFLINYENQFSKIKLRIQKFYYVFIFEGAIVPHLLYNSYRHINMFMPICYTHARTHAHTYIHIGYLILIETALSSKQHTGCSRAKWPNLKYEFRTLRQEKFSSVSILANASFKRY